MKAALFAVVVVGLIALATAQTIPALWRADITETRTFQNQTRSNKAVRWNGNDGHKSDRVDSDTGRGPIVFLTRLDHATPQVCNIFTQGTTQTCRCRKANANTTSDPFPWLKNSKVVRSTGPCPAPATGTCNICSLDDATVFGSPHKLFLLQDNTTPVQQESGAADRKVTVVFNKFDKGAFDFKVFDIPAICPPPPSE